MKSLWFTRVLNSVWVISTTLALRFFLFPFLLILEAHFIIITMMLLLFHFGFADSISQFPLQYGSQGFFWVFSNVSANTRHGILSSTQCEQTALCSTTHSVFRSLLFAYMPDTSRCRMNFMWCPYAGIISSRCHNSICLLLCMCAQTNIKVSYWHVPS